ncbi:hypothetical protein U5640_06845 [Streptomyces sp. SS7]|uniref:hypothetical protein n=1 Tax=Streptomyces sp. SS7 TaxID=3108485 RepID=UPI0030EE4B66
MTIQGPSDPDSIWIKFLTDAEESIRKSAPKEPSARDRALDPEVLVAYAMNGAPLPSAVGGLPLPAAPGRTR